MLVLYIILVISLLVGWFAASGIDKYQWVRLIDVFIYGPICIWLGFTTSQELWKNVFLMFLGATTITYNLKNYLGKN